MIVFFFSLLQETSLLYFLTVKETKKWRTIVGIKYPVQAGEADGKPITRRDSEGSSRILCSFPSPTFLLIMSTASFLMVILADSRKFFTPFTAGTTVCVISRRGLLGTKRRSSEE